MIGPSVDTAQASLGALLRVGIQLEAAAQRLYEGLAERFSHCPEVAQFWLNMAADEACHRNRLTEWRASVSVERLSQPVDVKMLRLGEKLLGTGVAELLDEVQNLDDAYEMAHDLESSETNAIFRFFITESSQDPRVLAILMHDLEGHMERLATAFPVPYTNKMARTHIQAFVPASRGEQKA